MNIFRRLILAAVFVFCQTYAHSAAEAATYYVKPTGSDAANGLSEATAWQHVMKACQTLVAGDTVLIRAGTYDETSVVYAMAPPGNIQAGLVPVNSGTPGRHIVFKGYPGDVRPVILGRDTRNGPMRSAVLLAHGEHHITYDSLHFHKGETGIMIRDNPPAYDITLRNLIIDSTYMSADDNNGGVSMYLSGYYGNDPVTGPSQRNILIENCDIFSNGSQFRGSYRASGIHSYSCDSCTIRNNTIHNEVYGINFKYATRFTEVYGNTIYDCDVGYNGTAHAGGSLSYDGPDQVGSIFHHNILYRNNLGIGLTIFGNAGTRYPDSLHYIYNNTIDCSGPYVDPSLYLTGVGIYQRYGHFNRSYYFNNIIYNPVTAARVDAEDTRAAMAHGNESQTPYRFYDDYNMFYSSAGVTNFYMWGTTAYTLSGWRAATPNATITGGADTGDYIGGTVGTHGDHSIVANPLFVNAANRDYRLQSGSPALTSGKGGTFEFYPTYTINLKSGSQRRTLPTYMGAIAPTGSCTLPSAPTLATPADGATGLTQPIVLDWNDVATATNYQVQVDNNSDFSSVTLDQQVTASTYSVSGLTSGTTYYWRTRAQNACGWGSWAASRTFAVAACALPATVVLSLPVSGATGLSLPVVLDWNDVATATNYQVQVDNNSDFSSVALDQQVAASTYSVSGLTSPATYYWRARAQNACGWGTWSASRTFALNSTDIVAPIISGVTVTGIVDNAAVVTWTTNEPATSQVNYGTTAAYGSTTTLAPTLLTAHSQALSGLSPLTLYHYRVPSRDAAGNEGVSGDYTFATSEALTNLDNGITPTVSSTYEGYAAAKLTDGQLNPFGAEASTWASTESATQPHWVEVNMGSSRVVKKVVLYWAWNSFQSKWMTSRQVKLQRWNGTAFVDITTTNNSVADSCTIIDVASVSTTRLRYYQPANMGAVSYPTIAWLAEIDILGTTSTNTAPTVPTLSSPAAGATVTTLAPTLVLNNATDTQGNPITYDFQISTATTFATIAAQVTGVTQGTGSTTSWTVSPNLTSGTTYYWRVRSNDGALYSAYAAYRSFTTSVTNSAPGVPTPQSPINGARISDVTPDLVVVNSIDANGDPLTYQFEVYNSAGTVRVVQSPLVASGSTTTTWTVSNSLAYRTAYTWRARAYDGQLWSSWTALQNFRTNRAPAVVVSAEQPVDSEVVQFSKQYLTVTSAGQSADDSTAYLFEVYDGRDTTLLLKSAILKADSSTVVWAVPSDLESGKQYFWRVRTADGSDSSEWTSLQSFTKAAVGICGDDDGSGTIDIGDAIYLLNYMFANGPSSRSGNGDVNCDEQTSISDAVLLIHYLFAHGSDPCAKCGQ